MVSYQLPYNTGFRVSIGAFVMRFGTLTSTSSGSLRHFPFVVVPLQVDLLIQVPDFPFAVHVFGGGGVVLASVQH